MNTGLRFSRSKAILFVLAALISLAGYAGSAQASPLAATIAVNTFADDLTVNGNCTLREAVLAANTDQPVDACPAGSGADTISLAAGEYTLSLPGRLEDSGATGDLDVSGALTITGQGEGVTILQAAQEAGSLEGVSVDRLIEVQPAAQLTLNGLTLRDGFVMTQISDEGEERDTAGGCLLNHGQLSVSDALITNCLIDNTSQAFGAAVANYGHVSLRSVTLDGNGVVIGGYTSGLANAGTAEVYDSTFYRHDGTIYNEAGGTVVVERTQFLDNMGLLCRLIDNFGQMSLTDITIQNITADYEILRNRGDLTVVNANVLGNTAELGSLFQLGGTARVENSIIHGSIANESLVNITGTAELLNSTISGNASGGGVIGVSEGTLEATHLTVNNNHAGYALKVSGGAAQAANSIFAATHTQDAPDQPDCLVDGGSLTWLGGNIVAIADGCGWTAAAGDQLGSADQPLNPGLQALEDNGGPTLTHALLPGSPALDAGNNAACLPTDQRGQPRPQDGDGNGTAACDSGAFEAPATTVQPTQPPKALFPVVYLPGIYTP